MCFVSTIVSSLLSSSIRWERSSPTVVLISKIKHLKYRCRAVSSFPKRNITKTEHSFTDTMVLKKILNSIKIYLEAQSLFLLLKFRSNSSNTFLRCPANFMTLWSELPPLNTIHSRLYQKRAKQNHYTQNLHLHSTRILTVQYRATLCIIYYNIPFPQILWERATSHLPFINHTSNTR